MRSSDALRRRDGQEVERLDVRVADARAGAHDLHRAAAVDRLELGQVVLADERVAGRLEPVLGERALQAADDRAAHADVRVAPVLGVLGVAGPLLGDADAADHPDPAVDDQQLAVRAVVQPPQRVGLGRAEARDAHAGVAHLVDQVAGPSSTLPTQSEQHVDLDALTGALGTAPRPRRGRCRPASRRR